MLDRMALLAGTFASAMRLRKAWCDDPLRADIINEASSVAGVALDLAEPEMRETVREMLLHHQLLGDEPEQFPANPWVLWYDDLNQPIVMLLRSVKVDNREVERILQNTPLPTLLTWTTPTAVLGALGLPHRSIVLPRWVLPTVAATLVAVGVGAMIKWRD